MYDSIVRTDETLIVYMEGSEVRRIDTFGILLHYTLALLIKKKKEKVAEQTQHLRFFNASLLRPFLIKVLLHHYFVKSNTYIKIFAW